MIQQIKQVFLFTGIALVLFSCKEKSDLISKTWKVKDAKCLLEFPPEMQPVIDNWRADVKKYFTITYRVDSTYTSTMNTNSITGKWWLSEDKTKIHVVSDHGMYKTSDILELNNSKYTFRDTIAQQVFIFEMVPAN